MMLYIRMGLYAAFAGLAGMGYGEMSADGGSFTVSISQTAEIVGGALGFGGTFVASRIAKARGGAT